MERTKGAPFQDIFWPWMRMVCQSEYLLQLKGIDVEALLADRAYDTNSIIKAAMAAGIQVVIPPKKNRKEQREYRQLHFFD